MSALTSEALRSLPKVEIHLHLEGSIDLDTLLAIRRSRGEPDREDVRRQLASLYEHRDFPHFLRNFRDLCLELRSPADFAVATERLLGRLASDQVRYAEVMVSPTIFSRLHGLPADEILGAIGEAAERAASSGGPRLRFLLDGVRQWGPADFERLLRAAVDGRGRGVIGIGLGGDETASPPEAFAEFYEEARRAGLRTTAHAGEFDGARSVWKALEVLNVDRVGHGVRALEDRELMRVLQRRRLPLECCPTSNVRTRVVSSWAAHPIRDLHRAGAHVTVNSDDPAMFGTTLGGEWSALVDRVGLSLSEALLVGRRTIEAAFLPGSEKEPLLRAHDEAAAAVDAGG